MKTAIVTGGATGIGRAVSSLFAEKGYNVVIGYNKSIDAAKELETKLIKQGFSAVIYNCDVTKTSDTYGIVDFAVQKFGKVDTFVCNAGIAQQKLITDITDEDWSNMINTNLTGCFNCCRAAAKSMISRHSGSIVNISSMWGISGASCEVHYSASKSGVIGLTKALAKELAPSNIRVNCVAPGVIKTDMLSSFSAEDLERLRVETPLSRLGTPEDIAKAVLFLSSDDASFITGQVLSVDGGFIL
ncbi:elongation factor P 5-aminopentanone reductase [Methanobrevibacter sp.]|uniref:elongation factor P 5-aminopentanone reductase n=1 Tax=Methanobrevibacter sp. TaxID=66852 RepID=UPI00388EB961